MVLIQETAFDINHEINALTEGSSDYGAVVTFVGLVRDMNDGRQVSKMLIEHYPKMTESVIQHIIDDAKRKWSVGNVRVIHRYGELQLKDPIVFVGVASVHRKEAFHAAEYIMDFLKTKAPFWKKEYTEKEAYWVEAHDKDQQEVVKWENSRI